MLKIAENTELNQISLTGMRALVLLGLLMQAPRTLEEIRETFINLKIMEPEHSDDILRIDLNTLRAMGCEISRAGQKTDYKYVLEAHPFALNIIPEEVSMLKRIYKKVKGSSNIALLIKYDILFSKLANYVADSELKEALLGLSVLKSFDVNLVDELNEECKNNKILTILYKKPSAKNATEINLIAEKVVFHNDKFYLYGFDLLKKASVTLNIKRILAILSKRNNNEEFSSQQTVVTFRLQQFESTELEENERIIETQENSVIVEGKYYNEFLALQRLLSFGSKCIVIEPEEIRAKIIEKLKSIRRNYNV